MFITWHKTISKWIKDTKVELETLKLVEKNIGGTLYNIGKNRKNFLNRDFICPTIMAMIDKWDFIKLK